LLEDGTLEDLRVNYITSGHMLQTRLKHRKRRQRQEVMGIVHG